MSCDEIQELLSDLLDDELTAGAKAGVEGHLATCEGCARAYKKLRRTVGFVRRNSTVNLAPGTTGALYAAFDRALVDEEYRRERERILREDVFGGQGEER